MMIINISDVYSLHQINRICDPMNDFISTLDSSSYYGCIGYEMRKRPNSKAYDSKKDKFAEPMWGMGKDIIVCNTIVWMKFQTTEEFFWRMYLTLM